MSDISLDTVGFETYGYENDQEIYTTSWLGHEITLGEESSVNAFAEGLLASKHRSKPNVGAEVGFTGKWGGEQKPSLSIDGSVLFEDKRGNYLNAEIQQSLSNEESSARVKAGHKPKYLNPE